MILYKIQDSILMSPAKRDRVILLNLILSLLINITVFAVLFFAFYQSKDYIILRYNIYFGISSFGPWYNILIIPVIGLLAIIFNFALSFYLYIKEKVLSYFLAFATSVLNILLLVATLILIYVNI